MSDIEFHMNFYLEWDEVSLKPNICMCDIENGPDKHLILDERRNHIFNADEYIDQWLCKSNVLSIHDEDYDLVFVERMFGL